MPQVKEETSTSFSLLAQSSLEGVFVVVETTVEMELAFDLSLRLADRK